MVARGMTIRERMFRPSANIGPSAITIYGRGGVGKTTLFSTMPGEGLILDTVITEGGTMVLTPWANHIQVVAVDQWNDFEALFIDLQRNNATYGFQWVGIDSLTGAQVLAKRKTIGDRTLESDPALVSQNEWGKIGELMTDFILRLRTLGLHVICTAQERLRDNVYTPNLSPVTLGSLEPPMFLIGRLYTVEVPGLGGEMVTERRLRVGPHNHAMTKARAVPGRRPPAVIRNPSLGHILGYMMGLNVPPPEEAQVDAGFLAALGE